MGYDEIMRKLNSSVSATGYKGTLDIDFVLDVNAFMNGFMQAICNLSEDSSNHHYVTFITDPDKFEQGYNFALEMYFRSKT